MDPLLKVAAACACAAVVAVAVVAGGPRTAPPRPSVPVPAYSQALAARSAAYAAAAGPNAPKAAAEAGGIRLRSVGGFELPTSDGAFPPRPGAELLAGNCESCHSPGMILTQPRLTAGEWTAAVNKMRTVYKAPVDEAEVPAIVAYLTSLQTAP